MVMGRGQRAATAPLPCFRPHQSGPQLRPPAPRAPAAHLNTVPYCQPSSSSVAALATSSQLAASSGGGRSSATGAPAASLQAGQSSTDSGAFLLGLQVEPNGVAHC